MQATMTATQPASPELINVLQQELDSAWTEFFGLGDEPWSVQRIAAQTVIGLRRQIEALGAVPA
jgi:hypothetical protein